MNKVTVKPTKRYPNLKELLKDVAFMYGERDAYRYKNKKEIISKTYNDLLNDSMTFSNVLKNLNLTGKHIAVSGASSYEWIITYFGTVNSNSVIIPLDKELPAEDIAELINRADASAFVYDKTLYDRIEKIKSL